MPEELVNLSLSRAEALVLFEWLSSASEHKAIEFADPAEEQVLWNLEAQLESILIEPLEPNYVELVQAARREVRGD